MAPQKGKRKRANNHSVDSSSDGLFVAPAKKQQLAKGNPDGNASVIVSSNQNLNAALDLPTHRQRLKLESDDGRPEQSAVITRLTGRNLEALSKADSDMQEVRHMIDNHEERFLSFSQDNEAWKEKASAEAKDTRDHVQKQITDLSLRMDNQIEGIKDFFLHTFRSELSIQPRNHAEQQQMSASNVPAHFQQLSEGARHGPNMASSSRLPMHLSNLAAGGGEYASNTPSNMRQYLAPEHVMTAHGQVQQNNGPFVPSQQPLGGVQGPLQMHVPPHLADGPSSMKQGQWTIPRLPDSFVLNSNHGAERGKFHTKTTVPPTFTSSPYSNTRDQNCEPQTTSNRSHQPGNDTTPSQPPRTGREKRATAASKAYGQHDEYDDYEEYDEEYDEDYEYEGYDDYDEYNYYEDEVDDGARVSGEVDSAGLDKAVKELGLAPTAYSTAPRLTKAAYQQLLRTFDFSKIELLEAFSRMDDRRQPREYTIFCDVSHPSMWIDYVIQVSEAAYSMMDHASRVRFKHIPSVANRDLSRLRILKLKYDDTFLTPKQSIIYKRWQEENQPPKYILEIGSLVLRHKYTKKMKDKLHDTDLSLVMDVAHPNRPLWLLLRPGWKESCRKTAKSVRDATRAFDGALDDVKIACVCKDIRSLQLTWRSATNQSAQHYVGAQMLTKKTQLKLPVSLVGRGADIAEMKKDILAARGEENGN
ncbi:hypothetical protein G7054_g9710 [Neopestalotiopsis clavispora]|nr:hypothetical protein G7054_g9710 [Neopestalotiopsis clavispora]